MPLRDGGGQVWAARNGNIDPGWPQVCLEVWAYFVSPWKYTIGVGSAREEEVALGSA